MRCIDLHADTISALMCGVSKGNLRENTGQVDLAKLAQGGVGAQFLACYFDKTKVEVSLYWIPLVAQGVKNSPAMRETWV